MMGRNFQTSFLCVYRRFSGHMHRFIVIIREQEKKTYNCKFILSESRHYFLYDEHEELADSLGNIH